MNEETASDRISQSLATWTTYWNIFFVIEAVPLQQFMTGQYHVQNDKTDDGEGYIILFTLFLDYPSP